MSNFFSTIRTSSDVVHENIQKSFSQDFEKAKKYKVGEISPNTGLQKQADGSWKPPKKTKQKYDGSAKLKSGDVLRFGRYNQFKLEVKEDLGDSVRVVNRTSGYKKDPYDIPKSRLRGYSLDQAYSKFKS